MKIRQHIPSFVDYRDSPPCSEFSTLTELEAIEWVAHWKTAPHFLRFSKSDNYLMAEFSPSETEPTGAHWVIGHIDDASSVDLPQWVETEAQRLSREAWNRGEVI